MPPPPDETSRPARRRALGRGPGAPRTAPAEPRPAPETAQAPSPAPEPHPTPAAASTPPGAESPPAPVRRAASPDAEPGPGPAAASTAPGAECPPVPARRSASADLPGTEPGPGPAEAHPGAGTARQPAPGTADGAFAPPADGKHPGLSRQAPAGPAGARRSAAVSDDEVDIASGLGVDAPAGDGDPVVDPAEARHGDGAAAPAPAAPPVRDGGDDGRFTVRLANFEGPFDLLLQLISKHKLDVTEVALSKVTDEFMAHIRAMGPDWDLDQTTEFLVVAATLLDLKAARLLPAAEVEDEADLALLEARDLLFARLLQYRAYKQIATIFEDRWETEGRRYPRTVGLEAHHAELLPEVVISIGAEGFAKLAVKAMQPRAKPQVYVDHIHAPSSASASRPASSWPCCASAGASASGSSPTAPTTPSPSSPASSPSWSSTGRRPSPSTRRTPSASSPSPGRAGTRRPMSPTSSIT